MRADKMRQLLKQVAVSVPGDLPVLVEIRAIFFGVCPKCGKKFEKTNARQVACSNSCRVGLCRAKNKM